jgi:hypothetical protein
VKTAVVLRSSVIASVQVAAVPLQAPVQPVKVEPAAVAAVSVTDVPLATLNEQVAPQVMPAGVLVTVPLPVPEAATVSSALTVKTAVALRSSVIASVQVAAVPLQAPVQPVNVEPAAAAAVSVTVAPFVKPAPQVAPQAMPAGLLVTVPLPLPAFATASSALTVKTAVALRSPVIASVQVAAVPLQAPVQPVNVEPAAAAAVNVTVAPFVNPAPQVAPQAMPAGLLETLPLPVPDVATASCAGSSVNVAVTERAVLSETVQVAAVPLQAPLQPVKLEPAAATAVSVTDAPLTKLNWQVAPQSMPAGLLVTAPAPVPLLATVSCTGSSVKVAVTAFAAVSDRVHVDVPLQAPLQPEKLEPVAATAVSVTDAPFVKSAWQVAPQAMPAGLLVTVPDPVPAFVTAICTGSSVNVAVTDLAAVSETVHVDVPLQAPLQPVKLEPAAATAVSVTDAPFVKLA